jgi:hypothetical protein
MMLHSAHALVAALGVLAQAAPVPGDPATPQTPTGTPVASPDPLPVDEGEGATGYFNEPQVPPWRTVMGSPLHLLLPMAVVTAEVAVVPKLGLALRGGAGWSADLDEDAKHARRVATYEVAPQVRWYPIGNFNGGFDLIGEVSYVHVKTDYLVDYAISSVSTGLSVGGLVGFKLVVPPGLTMEIQTGLRVRTYSPHYGNPPPANGGTKPERQLFAFQLNFGWSF